MKRRLFAISGMLVILTTFVWVLAGCATSVPIKSVRPPTIDTSGIERMAIRPFENASGVGGAIGAQIPQYLTDKARGTITSSGKFTVVAANDPNADGIFTGRVTSITTNDTSQQIQRKDRQGNVSTITTYNREVTLSFEYSVISARTNMPIHTVSKSGKRSSSSESHSGLTDPLVLARQIVDSEMRNLSQDIIPTIVSSNRNLMNETSKDKEVKAKMKEALALVKNGNYQLAIQQYDAVGTVAAQTNANILREAIASDSAASAELTRLFSERGGPVEKAINGAVDALYASIPDGENITIFQSQSTERAMLDRVIDEMTKNIVQSGKLTMVDRSNQALISAEQQFQLSGNVSDDSAISIGRQLGVHFIALCWISGEMSGRKLNLRVLNVETAEIVSQNSFEI